MKTWSMAINEQEGDIDTMPAALAKSLMPAKPGTKNPLRDNGAKPPDKAASALAPSVLAPAPMPAPMPYYHLPPQYYGAYNGPYHQPGYPPSLQAPVHVAPSPKRPLSAPHHFHQNMTHAQTNSPITLHGSSNGIPPSLKNSLHAWKCFKRKTLYSKQSIRLTMRFGNCGKCLTGYA